MKLLQQQTHSPLARPVLTLHVEHPLHADVGQALLAQLGADAEHLVGVRGHHPDAAIVQLAPGHWPLPPQLLHTLHHFKHLGEKAGCLKVVSHRAALFDMEREFEL